MSLIEKAFAVSQIVSCTGTDCNLCLLLSQISNTYNFFLTIAATTAIFILVVAGFLYILASGKKVEIEKSKRLFKNGILGLSLILTGWLIVHVVISSVGYKNSGNWWQFECRIGAEYPEGETSKDDLGSQKKTFKTLGDFLKSKENEGLIEGPTIPQTFIKDLETLPNGKQLTFLAPAKIESSVPGVSEIVSYVPFMTLDKAFGQVSINQNTVSQYSQFQEVAKGGDSGSSYVVSGNGGPVSRKTSEAINNWLLKEISSLASLPSAEIESEDDLDEYFNLLLAKLIRDYQEGKALDSDYLDSMISMLTVMILKETGTIMVSKDEAISSEGISDRTESILSDQELLDEINKILSGKKTESSIGDDDSGTSIRGDDGDDDSGDKGGKEPRTNTNKKVNNKNSNLRDNYNVNRNDSFKNSNYSPPTPPSNSNYKNDPITEGEDFSGWQDDEDNDYNKNKNDNFNCDYSKAKSPIEEALIRIECRDPLRYEMIHRYVKRIKNTTFQGGMCAGCGAIEVNFTLPLKVLDQIIVHESTHSGHFCVGMSEPIAEVERIAVGNQIGSVNRGKCDEHKGINFLMQEFPYQGKPVSYKGKEVRGYLSRWMQKVAPAGDLGPTAYDWPIQYALSYGDSTYGPFHYGDHDEQKDLGLKNSEEEKVEEIMEAEKKPEDKRECFSKAKSHLPKAGICEKTGSAEIEIISDTGGGSGGGQ